jgi:hypothetical protein
MKIIWQSIQQHFASTIFWSGRKLVAPGLGWAASSFLEGASGSTTTICETARLDCGKGLWVNLPGVHFNISCLTVGVCFELVVDQGLKFTVVWSDPAGSTQPQSQTRPLRRPQPNTWDFTILLGRCLREEQEDLTDTMVSGAVYTVVGREVGRGGTAHILRPCGRIRVYRQSTLRYHPAQDQQIQDPPLGSGQKFESGMMCVQ